ncbi:fimbria/pilus outer membrane usher protein [Steroidobacter sp.]|uniref:fimbria/pilus outer membrane usher protein n=1 Tax=Steroidobacter sp. TaxID=1978227 RepID=UPI001A3E4DA9|nr:fimbria/pilus outer membrane usher protein [Steroidobacter sp.]MBL8267266.1 fimbrial biogenesis outer membrane usher protein [Steroidobacter sp.]
MFLCQAAFADPTLPPAPTAIPSDVAAIVDATLYLDLSINGVPLGNVVPVQQSGDGLSVRCADLRAAGVSLAILADANAHWLLLDQASGIQHRYDPNALLLELTVPPEWLATQHLDKVSRGMQHASSSTGLVVNYGVHLIDGEDRPSSASLWTEQRLFGAAGVFTNTGLHRYADAVERESQMGVGQRGYLRFDTAWSSSNEQQLHSWTIGDLITSAQAWSAPARIAGIKLSRDFRLRPDLITYPLPQFSGQAAIPSTLDLFINGQRARSEQLRPGPYTITSMPVVTGAGEATLVTTDALGRQVTATLPFYASNELLRQGLVDYSLSLGTMRRAYGFENFSYGRFAGAGSLRYGLTNTLTLESQAEIASTAVGNFGLLGFGTVLTVGTLGLVNGAVSRSANYGAQGWQYSFGYRYANRGFNVGYQGTRSTRDFYTLATADAGGDLSGAVNSDIITAGSSLARFGSGAVSYLRVQPASGTPARLLNVSYIRQLSGALSLRIGASRDLQRREGAITAQLLASFGRGGNLTVGTQQDATSSEHIQYSRSVPSQGGLGWNVGHADGIDDHSFTDASLAWSGAYARAEAGVATYGEQRTRWADMRGSLLAMGSEVFAARQVSDAFVVVSTDGISGVPVRYENQLVGYTNRRGRLLVPWVTSHYAAKFSIDPVDLPLDVAVDDTEQRLVVKRRSGALLNFDTRRLSAVLLKLVDRVGVVLPVGSQALEKHSEQVGTVGYDGLVYFENLPAQVEVEVRRPDGSSCRVEAVLPQPALAPLVPMTCEDVR